jgi:hypothetical protein
MKINVASSLLYKNNSRGVMDINILLQHLLGHIHEFY